MNANLCYPWSVFVSNGEVFIADTYNHRVRKLLRNGQIVTIAGDGNIAPGGDDGDGELATYSQLNYPIGIAVSTSNQVYISEDCNYKIRKIDRHGIISTIAGTGVRGYNGDNQLAVHAQLYFPRGLFVTEDEEVYFCDMGNHRVRKIDRFGMISTIAGNGEEGYNGDDLLATNAKLHFPSSVYVYNNEVYITDTKNNRIRKVLQNGIITTIAGTGEKGYNGDDQPAFYSKLYFPSTICVHNDQVYFSDHYNHRVRKILPNGTIKAVAGNGSKGNGGDGNLAIEAELKYPTGLFLDDSGIYICCNQDSRIRKVDSNGIIRTIVGTGEYGYSGDVPFDFQKFPHIGPRKKQLIQPFPKALHDILIIHEVCGTCEPLSKKVKY